MTPSARIRRDLPRHPTVWPRQAGAPMFPFDGKDVRLLIDNGTLRVAPGRPARRVSWGELLTAMAILVIIGVLLGLTAVSMLSCDEDPVYASSTFPTRLCRPAIDRAGNPGLEHL